MPDISDRTIFFGLQKCLSTCKIRKFNHDDSTAWRATLNAFDLSATNDVTSAILRDDRDNCGFIIFVRSCVTHFNLGDYISLWGLRAVGARRTEHRICRGNHRYFQQNLMPFTPPPPALYMPAAAPRPPLAPAPVSPASPHPYRRLHWRR